MAEPPVVWVALVVKVNLPGKKDKVLKLIILLLFSIILLAIRFEKKQETIFSEVDISNEIGNETIAKINLSRSLIEMDQKIEAKRLLEEVLSSNLSAEEALIASNLLKKLESS